jgi:hypothetical protein
VENRPTLLARRRQRATRSEGCVIPTEPRRMVLEQKTIDCKPGAQLVVIFCWGLTCCSTSPCTDFVDAFNQTTDQILELGLDPLHGEIRYGLHNAPERVTERGTLAGPTNTISGSRRNPRIIHCVLGAPQNLEISNPPTSPQQEQLPV